MAKKNNNQLERFGKETVYERNVASEAISYNQIAGANKNVYRIAPSLNDGLKPGRRRLYWSWWIACGRPQNTKPETLKKLKFMKVDTVASLAMAYHPHGSSANEELIGREGQYWNNNVMAIVPQGSYGNLQSSDPAAGRYIEARIGEYMIDCFFDDFDKYSVPMRPSYDGMNLEPVFLPSKYPHILFNPQMSGIGYALASNIMSFNVKEVLEATIELMKDPSAKIMLIPDSPTGADIIDEGYFGDINKTGEAKVTLRATASIDYQENTIHITSIPLQTKTNTIINKIVELKKKHEFEEIINIDDGTKEGEVDVLIALRSDANPDKVLEKLYKKNTNLKMTYPIGLTVIDDFKPYTYGVKDLLLEWIEYRREVVRSMFLYSLQITEEKQHMNKVLVMVFNKDNIEKTVAIAKKSKSRQEMIQKLMKTYKITSLQAATIADMRVYNFNEDYYKKYKQEEKDLKAEIKKINNILDHDSKIDDFIIGQLEEGIKKYGRPRKSKVIREGKKSKKNIPDIDYIIGINEEGYIKKLNISNNSSIGYVGKSNCSLTVLQINNRDDMLVFDSTGNVSKVSVSAIPDMKFTDTGVELSRYFSVKGRIIGTIKLPSEKLLKTKDDDLCIIFITKNGYGKKVKISEFDKIVDYKTGITLNPGDELSTVLFAFDKSSKDLVICTNLGDGVRLKVTDIKTVGRTAKGTRLIGLKDGEYVVNACRIKPRQKYLFYITTGGRIKLTETKFFPVMEKKDSAISLISLVGSETLVGVSSVSRQDTVMVYRKTSEPELVKISDMKITTRIAKGEKVIKTPKGDAVIAYKIFEN